MRPQQNTGPTFFESYALARWLMQFPALTLMVLMRGDIGYRLLNPLILLATTGGLAVIAILAMPYNQDAGPGALLAFAGFAFAAGMIQRIRRWFELRRKPQQHSYYIGTSFFDCRFIPNFCRRNRRMGRYVDPIFWAIIGVALFPYARLFSFWLVFAAMCLRGYEDQTFRRQRNVDLDMIDSLIASDLQAKVLEQYEQEVNAPQQQADAAIPTGLGDDIKEHIKQRKNTP